jgi:hypothetical protein
MISNVKTPWLSNDYTMIINWILLALSNNYSKTIIVDTTSWFNGYSYIINVNTACLFNDYPKIINVDTPNLLISNTGSSNWYVFLIGWFTLSII